MVNSDEYNLAVKKARDEEAIVLKMLREIDGMGQNHVYEDLLVDGAVMGCQYGNQYSKIKKSSLEYAYVGYDEVFNAI